MAEWFGEAPSNAKACDLTADPSHCETSTPNDEAYFDQVAYWTTPVSRTAVTTAARSARTTRSGSQAWTEIKG